jgi:hypothetical protein
MQDKLAQFLLEMWTDFVAHTWNEFVPFEHVEIGQGSGRGCG